MAMLQRIQLHKEKLLTNPLLTAPAIRAKIKNRQEWQHLDSCSLDISMGNKWQDGPYLSSQIRLVNQRFKSCFLHIGDTLQRHNLMDRMSLEDAHTASYIMGSAWLARNAEIIEGLQIPYKIIRWDHWLSQPEFPALHAAMREYYDSNVFFRKIVGRDVALFTTRNPEANPARCVDYLLEEAAADTLFCRQNPVARLYPASELSTYTHLSKTEIPLPIKGLDRGTHLRVSFHRRGRGASQTAASAASRQDSENAYG